MNSKKILEVCLKCKSSCCKLGGADFTKKEMEKIAKSGAKIKFCKVSKNHYEFKTNGKGVCAYLGKTGACEIYKVRPSGCSCWPVEYPEYNKKGKPVFFISNCLLTKHLSKKDIKKLKKIAGNVTKEISEGCIKNSNISKKEMNLCLNRYSKFKMRRLK